MCCVSASLFIKASSPHMMNLNSSRQLISTELLQQSNRIKSATFQLIQLQNTNYWSMTINHWFIRGDWFDESSDTQRKLIKWMRFCMTRVDLQEETFILWSQFTIAISYDHLYFIDCRFANSLVSICNGWVDWMFYKTVCLNWSDCGGEGEKRSRGLENWD